MSGGRAQGAMPFSTGGPSEERYTRDGYRIDDFVASSEDDSDPELSWRAMHTLRHRVDVRRARRREDAIAYPRLAAQQRTRRIMRGMPAEEEDCAEENIEAADDDDGGAEYQPVEESGEEGSDTTSNSAAAATAIRLFPRVTVAVGTSRRRRHASHSPEQPPAQRRRRVVIVVSD